MSDTHRWAPDPDDHDFRCEYCGLVIMSGCDLSKVRPCIPAPPRQIHRALNRPEKLAVFPPPTTHTTHHT